MLEKRTHKRHLNNNADEKFYSTAGAAELAEKWNGKNRLF